VRIRGAWPRKGALIVVIVALFGAGAAAGYALRSSGTNRRAQPDATVSTLVARQAALKRAVSFSPRQNAVGVAPDAPVVVSTNRGWLTRVRLVTATGQQTAGTFSETARDWLSGAPLAADTAYRVTAVVYDVGGLTSSVSSTFRTLVPAQQVNASVFPTDGLSVGIGQPIVLRFDHAINDEAARAAVLSHVTIIESRPVPGGWHWFSASELHFRPRSYWPTGEQITVAISLDGWNAGDGRWGNGALHTHFSIGHAHVSVADLANYHMTVRDNGRVVAVYPMSGGRPEYPTMNGTHIVMDRQSVVHMVSSSVGIPVNSPDGYDEMVYADVHISDSGEYVHAAPWSQRSQGNTNVSHGCINLSPTDALAFFAFSRVGDIVQVAGGPRPAVAGDHGVMDWDTPWSQWTPSVVHPLHPPHPRPTHHTRVR
jgi:lipoprotein-anchoring transpeptidase ErfK/SrfK